MVLIIYIFMALFPNHLAHQNIDLLVELHQQHLIFGETLDVSVEVTPKVSIRELQLELKLPPQLNFTIGDATLNCSSKCEEILALRDKSNVDYQSLNLLNAHFIDSGIMLMAKMSLPNLEADVSPSFDQVLIVNASFTYNNGSVDYIIDQKNFTLTPIKVALLVDRVPYEIHSFNEILLHTKNRSNEVIFTLTKQWPKAVIAQVFVNNACGNFCVRNEHQNDCKPSREFSITLEIKTLNAEFEIDFGLNNVQCQDVLEVLIDVRYGSSAVDLAKINFRQSIADVICSINIISAKNSSFEADDIVEYEALFHHSANSTADALILYAGLDVHSSIGLTVDHYATLFTDTVESQSDFTYGLRPGVLLRGKSIAIKFRLKLNLSVVLGATYSLSFIYEFDTIFEALQDRGLCRRTCKNGGFCDEFHGAPVCICPTGFTGDACEQKICLNNWVSVPLNQVCYFVDSTNRSYFDANDQCLSVGGAIAGIDSYSDFISLNILIKKYNFTNGLWLGYNTFLQEEGTNEVKSTWYHVEYASGQSIPSEQECLSFYPEIGRRSCRDLRYNICIDKRNYVMSNFKAVPLLLQIAQPKVNATISGGRNDFGYFFASTVHIFLPRGTLNDCRLKYDIEPKSVNISLEESCLTFITRYSRQTNCSISVNDPFTHRLSSMVFNDSTDSVLYEDMFSLNNDSDPIQYTLKIYFICHDESRLIGQQSSTSSSAKLQLAKYIKVNQRDKYLEILASIKHMVNSTEAAYNIRYEDDLSNLNILSIADQCKINKSTNRLCFSKDELAVNDTLSFSYDVKADQNLTFDQPFYLNSSLDYSSLKPGVLYTDNQKSRGRTSIEVSTCIVRREDIVVTESKVDKRSIFVFFILTFVMSFLSTVIILYLFMRFCPTENQKADNVAPVDETCYESGKPDKSTAPNAALEEQDAQQHQTLMSILLDNVDSQHDMVKRIELQDIEETEQRLENDRSKILLPFISMWLKNFNISQEVVHKILIDIENVVLKFEKEAQEICSKNNVENNIKQFLENQQSSHYRQQLEFAVSKFIRSRKWHQIWIELHSILKSYSNILQGEQLCSKFYGIFFPVQCQLAMHLMRRFSARSLAITRQNLYLRNLKILKHTAIEHCSKVLENHEKIQSDIQCTFDALSSELEKHAQLQEKKIQSFNKEVDENENARAKHLYLNMGNLDQPDVWISEITGIRIKSIAEINDQEIHLAEQYFHILEKLLDQLIEKCSTLSSILEDHDSKNLNAALAFKVMRLRQEMQHLLVSNQQSMDEGFERIEGELRNWDGIASQMMSNVPCLSHDERLSFLVALYIENDLSSMIRLNYNIGGFDQNSELPNGCWHNNVLSYPRYILAKLQASKVEQLSQLKFDTWCLEILTSSLITYILEHKLLIQSVLQQLQDDHQVEWNFLYNQLLTKKNEEENYEEKEMRKKHARFTKDSNSTNPCNNDLLSLEKLRVDQNFTMEQGMNDIKRLCKLRMEQRLLEEKQTLISKLIRVSRIHSNDVLDSLQIMYPNFTMEMLRQKFELILTAGLSQNTECRQEQPTLCDVVRRLVNNSAKPKTSLINEAGITRYKPQQKATPRLPIKLPPLDDPRLSSRTITVLKNRLPNVK